MPLSSKVIKQVYDVLEKTAVHTRNVVLEENVEDHTLIKKAKHEADEILKKARLEADKLLEKTQSTISSLEQKAYEEGYEKGYQDGWQSVKKEAEKIYESASEVLRQAEEIKKKIYSETEEELIDLAIDMAEKLVCRQLDLVPETIVDIARAACQQKRESQKFVIYVNPSHLEILRTRKQDIISELDSPANIQIIADSNLEPAGCRVETEQGYIDGTLQTMLEKLGLAIKDDIL
ncbi:MAG: flagellar assembly protein FliH [Clostridia bacterium]|jgi:flagellar assembly protein FliH|nr:Flagellar assembly protein FliH/Type secretion system HrpE [Clostridiales bacterium]MDK2985130.1 flagellar assembly protein FliH [Clostridia bacterium]